MYNKAVVRSMKRGVAEREREREREGERDRRRTKKEDGQQRCPVHNAPSNPPFEQDLLRSRKALSAQSSVQVSQANNLKQRVDVVGLDRISTLGDDLWHQGRRLASVNARSCAWRLNITNDDAQFGSLWTGGHIHARLFVCTTV